MVLDFFGNLTICAGLSAVYGFCISANYSLTSPILVDIVSIEHFSSAYGVLLASQVPTLLPGQYMCNSHYCVVMSEVTSRVSDL